MAPQTRSKVDDEAYELYIKQQAELNELTSELERVNTQRKQADKENETLRLEISRLKTLIENNNRTDGAGLSGTQKTNVFCQTENFDFLNYGKHVTHLSGNRDGHCEVDIFDETEKRELNNQRYENKSKQVDKDEHYNKNEYSDNNVKNGVQDELLRGMLNYFESMQVSMPVPKFDGIKKNPIEFIKELEKYFFRKNISENLKLVIIEDALVGKARMWHDARTFPFINYQHFKDKFLDEFYSVEARMLAKSIWENRRFQLNDRSLQDYYTEQFRNAKFCLSSLEEYEVNYLIVKQLPQRAREVLATIDYKDTAKIMQALTRLDVTRQDVEREMATYNKNNYSANNNNGGNNKAYRTISPNENGQRNDPGPSRQQGGPRNNYEDSSKNWRQGGYNSGRATREQNSSDNSRKPNDLNNRPEKESLNTNVNAIQKSNMAEFVNDLCWDVETDERVVTEKLEMKVSSPRILAKISEIGVNVLVDSGSEVTALSEQFYEELKTRGKIIELPVSNLTVSVAVGKKVTTIRRQIQLTLDIGTLKLSSPFLVVPGLTTNVLVGIDWLTKFKGVIDTEKQCIKLEGDVLPNELVTFHMAREKSSSCRVIEINSMNWYDAETSGCRLGDGITMVEEISCSQGDENMIHLVDRENCSSQKCMRQITNETYVFKDEVYEYVARLNSLTDVQKGKVIDLLLTYENVFSNEPGCTNIYSHSIKLSNKKTVVRKSYPVAFNLRPAVNKKLKEMFDLGIIEYSDSEFCNPLRIVIKKNGEVRICLDARFINAIILSDNESPPIIEELLQKFEGVKYLSTTDLVLGYWQIPLEPESRKYTAFLHEGHLYQFTRVPFGLKTAGGGFIRALNLALGQEYSESISCYIDDILIASQTFEGHLRHLSNLFTKLWKSGFKLSLKKSSFFREEVSFLGFQISPEGIRADSNKLSVIADFPAPKDKRQLQAFLGMCGYYRRFSVRHADFVGPFRNLLSKEKKWNWTEGHSLAFEEIKGNFLKSVTLSHFLPNKKFRLQTDASDIGISGILYQIDDNDDIRIVSLASRVLTQVEYRYTTTEKELLAIVYSILKFRTYLIGWEFQIITDHQALTFLLSTPYQNSRLMRWILSLQEYNFSIVHCKGSDNIVADFFSRNFKSEVAVDNHNDFLLCKMIRNDLEEITLKEASGGVRAPIISFDRELLSELRDLQASQRNDAEIQSLVNRASDKIRIRESSGVLFVETLVDNRVRIILPRNLIGLVLKSVHEQFGHAGCTKMHRYIERYFYWKRMRRDIKCYTRACDLCQRTKHVNYKMEGEWQFVESKKPNDLVSVDFYGPLPVSRGGVSYIFVVQDIFSKFVTLYPIKRANTKICLSKLKGDYFLRVGKPERLLSDHGTQFTSPLWKAELEAVGVKSVFSSIRHPQSNPVERTMRELGRYFRTFCANKHTGWACHVSKIQDCLNLVTHESTGMSPYEIHYGKSPKDKLVEMFPIIKQALPTREIQLQQARERTKKAFDQRLSGQKKVSTVQINVGDLVLLRVPHLSDLSQRVTRKFFHLFEGPYEVKKILNRNAFVLVDSEDVSKVKGTYNRFHLRRYHRFDEL